MERTDLFTIGFTRKTAEGFFSLLRDAGVRRVVDVRLNNTSQLAGFSKKEDLRYFLRAVAGIDYVHLPDLAPTQDILDEYKKEKGGWAVYETKFLALMENAGLKKSVDPALLQHSCLLCTEEKPHHCHRRLVAEYLEEKWGGVKTTHLG